MVTSAFIDGDLLYQYLAFVRRVCRCGVSGVVRQIVEISMHRLNSFHVLFAPGENTFAVFEFIHNSTEIDVRFHSGCISPYVLPYHFNHMVVQMMCITVERELLIPKLWAHVHSFKICAEFLQIADVLVLNHFHHSLSFSNCGNVDNAQAVIVHIDLFLWLHISRLEKADT